MSESPSVIEAQDFIRRQIGAGHYMSPERLEVLNSAMSFVNRLLRATKADVYNAHTARVANVMEGIMHPSIELLYWMLRGSCLPASQVECHLIVRGRVEGQQYRAVCVGLLQTCLAAVTKSDGPSANQSIWKPGNSALLLDMRQLGRVQVH